MSFASAPSRRLLTLSKQVLKPNQTAARAFSSAAGSASTSTSMSGSSSSQPDANNIELKDLKFTPSGKHFATITLDREKKLNSVNRDMMLSLGKLYPRNNLGAKSTSPAQGRAIWLEGAGEKAFCAGGDITEIQQALAKPGDERDTSVGERFFKDEYEVDYRIGNSNNLDSDKQIVTISVWDKIVMGGGVGLGFFNPVRIVTERTMFAMPETKIGLFPDVGMTWGLSRLKINVKDCYEFNGNHSSNDTLSVGRYLGLTGQRLHAPDCLRLGIGTHFLFSNDLAELKKHVEEKVNSSNDASVVSPESIKTIIESFPKTHAASQFADAENVKSLKAQLAASDKETDQKAAKKFKIQVSEPENLALILRTFASPIVENQVTVGESLAALYDELRQEAQVASDTAATPEENFPRQTLKTLYEMSPLSLNITWAALNRHKPQPGPSAGEKNQVSLAEALKTEYRMAVNCLRPQPYGDFEEGVTALLVEKRGAEWSHNGVMNVPEEGVQKYFDAPGEGKEELELESST